MGKGPRRINPVSIFVVLVIVAIVYAAVKFVPVYLLNNKVDTILDEARHDAAQLNEFSSDGARDGILEEITDKIVDLGVDERYLQVTFEDDLSYIYANYRIVVDHPFGKTTTMEFEREVEVQRD
jgi:hypothetical protein